MIVASKLAVRILAWVGDVYLSMAPQALLQRWSVRELLHTSEVLDSLLARRAVFSFHRYCGFGSMHIPLCRRGIFQ